MRACSSKSLLHKQKSELVTGTDRDLIGHLYRAAVEDGFNSLESLVYGQQLILTLQSLFPI